MEMSMPSKRAKEHYAQSGWRDAGYRSQPGVPTTAPGASAENVMKADRAEATINATGEVPETFSPTPSLLNGHHPGPRTLSASWYPDSQVLVINFNPTSPASGGAYMYHSVSRDEWEAFKAAPSAGRYINDVLRYHSYGRSG
jgi:hypothetical protein